MLVLTRKVEESILLGEEVKITVLGVSGDKVRIGIDAPKTIKILRGETIEETRQQNRIAVSETVNVAQLLKSVQSKEE